MPHTHTLTHTRTIIRSTSSCWCQIPGKKVSNDIKRMNMKCFLFHSAFTLWFREWATCFVIVCVPFRVSWGWRRRTLTFMIDFSFVSFHEFLCILNMHWLLSFSFFLFYSIVSCASSCSVSHYSLKWLANFSFLFQCSISLFQVQCCFLS